MRKIAFLLLLVMCFSFAGCAEELQETVVNQTTDNTKEIVSAINDALATLELNEKYNDIIAKKENTAITVFVTTADYIWDEVQKDTALMNSYKTDFAAVYNKAVEAAKATGFDNIPRIDVLAWEPDENSVLATGSGTSDVTFLFE